MIHIVKLDKYSKTTKRLIVGIVLFILLTAVTFLFIDLYSKNTATIATNIPVTTPAELIKKYADNYRLNNYATDSAITSSAIIYKSSNSPYSIQINAPNNIQFERTDNSNIKNLDEAINNGSSYLAGEGFNKVSTQDIANANVITYDSQNNVCTLYDNLDPVKKASKYGLICADKTLFNNEYSAINALLNLNKSLNSPASIKSIARTTHIDGNKSVSLLSVTPNDGNVVPYTLVFASIDNKWEYIGKRSTPSVDVKDSFNIPSALKTAINNPKYGGFLTKYVY